MTDIFDNDDLDKDIEEREKFDCYCTYEAVCPYCGEEMSDSWELHLEGDGDEVTVECGECGEEYKVILNLEVTYSTEKLK